MWKLFLICSVNDLDYSAGRVVFVQNCDSFRTHEHKCVQVYWKVGDNGCLVVGEGLVDFNRCGLCLMLLDLLLFDWPVLLYFVLQL